MRMRRSPAGTPACRRACAPSPASGFEAGTGSPRTGPASAAWRREHLQALAKAPPAVLPGLASLLRAPAWRSLGFEVGSAIPRTRPQVDAPPAAPRPTPQPRLRPGGPGAPAQISRLYSLQCKERVEGLRKLKVYRVLG